MIGTDVMASWGRRALIPYLLFRVLILSDFRHTTTTARSIYRSTPVRARILRKRASATPTARVALHSTAHIHKCISFPKKCTKICTNYSTSCLVSHGFARSGAQNSRAFICNPYATVVYFCVEKKRKRGCVGLSQMILTRKERSGK